MALFQMSSSPRASGNQGRVGISLRSRAASRPTPEAPHDIGSHHISVKDLIDSNIIDSGDEVFFKDQSAVIQRSGNIAFKGAEYTSLSKWAKSVASALGLTKHYNGWNVALLKKTQRPMGQYRDKYYAENAGMAYTFPPLEPRKRKRRMSVGEAVCSVPSLTTSMRFIPSDGTSSDTSQHDSAWPDQRKDCEERKNSDPDIGQVLEDDFSSELGEEDMVGGLRNTTKQENGIDTMSSTHTESHCGQSRCYVCENLDTSFAAHFPTWPDILQVALYSLSQIRNNPKSYFSLGEEIYPFVDRHWYKLCSKPRNSSWRQTAKMTLAHSRYADLFENGYDTLMKTGYWRLKQTSRARIDALNGSVTGAIRASTGAADSSSCPSSPSNLGLQSSSGSIVKEPIKINSVGSSHPVNSFPLSSSPSEHKSERNEERISLLASLAGEASIEEENLLSALSATAAAKTVNHNKRPRARDLDDLEEYTVQHAQDRRQKVAQQHKSPETQQRGADSGTHKLRRDYTNLLQKFKTLEDEHTSTLSQMEKIQGLLLSTRQQGESTRISYAHQSELQDSQLRMLMDKIHRLENELLQLRSSNIQNTNNNRPPQSNSISQIQQTQQQQQQQQQTSSSVTNTTANNSNNDVTTSSSLASMSNFGLFPGNQSNALSGLYAFPWLSGMSNNMGWNFQDPSMQVAAKLQAQQIAQMQALLKAEANSRQLLATLATSSGGQTTPSGKPQSLNPSSPIKGEI